jgi:hypothetical protein
LIRRQLIAKLSQLLFALISQVIGIVPNLCRFPGLAILFGVSFRILAQLLDFLFCESTAPGD